MATTTDPQLSADSGGTPDLVGGGITRLNASDGLFLRAQHLTTMEDYSLALSRAIGVAAGTGVVYGYHVWLDGTILKVAAGLAMGPDGQPLRSNGVAEVDISKLTVAEDEFIVVEVAPADWDFGQENMYGNLCTDPCSQGGQIQPYRAEGITINLHHDAMPGLSAEPDLLKRNWLASAYYEREREQAGPWLVPYAPATPVPALDTRDFSSATAAPGEKAVPLAVLLKLDGGWVIDVWIARRDIGDPAPRRAWQWRLAMRPWDVFIAQVLQFQAQFNDDYQAARRQPIRSAAADDIAKALTELRDARDRQRITPGWLTRGISELEKVAGQAAEASQPGLRDQGFYELPPAGYVPPPPAKTDLTAYVTTLFGPYVDLRIRHCRADYAVRAVEHAQHLDRIPLDPSLQRGTPHVDVLVPSDLADLDALYAASYPWLAFVRRVKSVRRPRVDEVAVYLEDTGLDDPDPVAEEIARSGHPRGEGPMMVSYPADTYAVPTPPDVYKKVQETLRGPFKTITNLKVVGVGLASAEDRQPLAAVRAFLFLVGPPLGGPPQGGGPIEVDDIAVGHKPGLKPEAIVIVYGQARDPGK
jgi:hypothetical protein